MRSDEDSPEPTTARSGIPDTGRVVDGRYRIENQIGAGAMGVVMAARHVQLDERVAIKLLRSEYASNEEFRERFVREARAMIKIRSEHGVRVLDVAVLENGTPYLVMEYLEGNDLDSLLASKTPIGIERSVDLVSQAIEAIAEAHALGIIHRDLKPGNLFLTRRRDGTACLKVLDFGISKFEKSAAENARAVRITNATAIMGSPAYMSPEQMRSTRDVDARTDIWSLGVVLYELLGGRSPFVGQTGPEVCARVLEAAPTPLTEVRPELDEGLAAVVHRCLAKEPEHRFGNVAELAQALAPFGTSSALRSAETATRVLGLAPTAVHRLPPVPSARGAAIARAVVRGSDPSSVAWGRDATLLSGHEHAPIPAMRQPTRRSHVIPAGIALGLVLGVTAVLGVSRTRAHESPAPVAAAAVTPPASPVVAFELGADVAEATPAAAVVPVPSASAEVPAKPIAAPPLASARPVASATVAARAKARPGSGGSAARLHTISYDPARGLFDERK